MTKCTTQSEEDAALPAYREGQKPSKSAASSGDSTREVRVGRLDTVRAVRDEMSKLYRAARRVAGPRPTPAEATRLGWLLNAIGQSILANDLQARIEALEAERDQ